MKPTPFHSLTFLVVISIAAGLGCDLTAATPNIVFILADDLGYGDVQCNNPKSLIPTPNIDKLASQGRRFTEAHTPASVCSPTRYGLLTGRYAWRTAMKEGVLYDYDPALIKKGRTTVALLLKESGYHTPSSASGTLGWIGRRKKVFPMIGSGGKSSATIHERLRRE